MRLIEMPHQFHQPTLPRLPRHYIRPLAPRMQQSLSTGQTKGEFDLTSREGLLHPGSEGANVVPGKAGESRLMKLVRHLDEPHMPQKGEKLSELQIEKIARWIDAGAAYDAPLIAKGGAPKGHAVVTEQDREWWAFRPLGNHGRDARGTVDEFVLEKLREKGLTLNP